VLLFITLVSFLRISFISTINKSLLTHYILTIVLSLFVTFSTITLTLLYYLLDNFSSFDFVLTKVPGSVVTFSYSTSTFLLNQVFLGIHPASIYYFPFIYIFVLITILSILFCLAYNVNELTTFTFYCLVILSAGYTMFFTSSLLIFFLAYEMLLIPSFFILYNFAKTRKCVEAAYLMFF
jgi:NADH:ubiquinone oxidoreductase subunit 4 (subunit M)